MSQEQHRIMMNQVFDDLWKVVWMYEKEKLNTVEERMVLDYLFKGWGIIYDCLEFPCDWFKKNYYPDNIKIIIEDNDFEVSAVVFYEDKIIFEGIILNQEEQNKRVWSDNGSFNNYVDVHWDDEYCLYLWQKVY